MRLRDRYACSRSAARVQCLIRPYTAMLQLASSNSNNFMRNRRTYYHIQVNCTAKL